MRLVNSMQPGSVGELEKEKWWIASLPSILMDKKKNWPGR